MQTHTKLPKLRALNLLGVQFALCEGSKYIRYLEFDKGQLYRPGVRDFVLEHQDVDASDLASLHAGWTFVAGDS